MPEETRCPVFDPAPWDEKLFEWEKKTFIKDRVFSLFYMPKKQFMWYTTCPKCAKKYGKNYVAMVAQLN